MAEQSALLDQGRYSWFSEPCIMGIDEAGRGPVLGPMVLACAFTAKSQAEALKSKEFADSKTLSQEKREQLFAAMEDDATIDYCFDSLSAAAIAGKMLSSQAVSLNVLELNSTFTIINAALARGVNVHHVYVDTVGDPDRYREKLSQRFPGIEFTVCPKADALYPIVSAASIVAKVTRDRQLREYQAPESIEYSRAWGCGYPGDATTKQWLADHIDPVFGFPQLVRASWSTCTPLLDEKAVPVKWESEQGGGDGQQMLRFGASQKAADASCGMGRHSFFRARKLQRVHSGF